MVNSASFALAALAALLLTAGCARNDVSGGVVREQPAEKDNDNFHVFGRRAGQEPCSLSRLARQSCWASNDNDLARSSERQRLLRERL